MKIELVDAIDELIKDCSLADLKQMKSKVQHHMASSVNTTFVSELTLNLINAHIGYREIQNDEAMGLIHCEEGAFA